MIEPKYEAAIQMAWNSIHIYFQKQPSEKAIRELKDSFCTNGFEVYKIGRTTAKHLWAVSYVPLYSPYEISVEIEKILRKHGIKDIGIMESIYMEVKQTLLEPGETI